MTRHATLALLALALGGCATGQQSARLRPLQSPLELRQVQTRAFDTTDDQLVLKAALDALQDEGYVIREADAALGLVTGVMEWKSRSPNTGLRVLKWAAAIPTYGASLLLPTGRHEFCAVEANVHVTREPARTRVRVSLVERVTEKSGAVRSVRPVDDPLAYQALLARLDKALFLQKEGL